MRTKTHPFNYLVMNTIIAIEPDTKKSGVAIYHDKCISYAAMPFFELINKIDEYDSPRLYIEAGWLNKPKNFRYLGSKTSISNEVSARVGANHQIGKLIAEYGDLKKITYSLVKPLRKIWKGPDGKITASELNQLLKAKGYKELKRSNQDMRDAILILLKVL